MLKLSANKIFLAASALLLCAGFVQAQTEMVTPLTAAPTSVAISYQLPTTAVPTAVPVVLSVASGSDAFVIDPTTVPSWLSIGTMSGTAVPSPGVSVSFVASSTANTLGAGSYAASVHVRVSGFQDLVVPVTLSVDPPASSLSVVTGSTAVASGTTLTGGQLPALNWVYGSTPYPTIPLTILSSDAPVAFTASATVTNPAAPSTWIELSATSGIAYNFGTPLTVSFLPDVLQNSKVGDTLTGSIAIVYGGTTYTVNFAIAVTEPNAVITSIFPNQTPVHAAGTLTVVVTGSGFGTLAQGYTTATTVSITYGTVTVPVNLATITHGAVNVVNPTTIILTIPYQDATPVGILSTPQAVGISITNSIGGETPAPATLTVTNNPIIYSVTDGGALEEPATGVTPKFAPYEMITIFGDNLGPVVGTPIIPAPGVDSRYPDSLSLGGLNTLTVAFNNQTGTAIANAYLVFASNNQINALVPSTIIGTGITGLQIVVTASGSASTAYLAAPVATNPGIFTTAASGQGPGAILNPDYSVNSSINPVTTGKTVSIYASGLGVPNSTAASSSSTKTPVFPTSCFLTSAYVTGEGLTNPVTADGAVLVSSVWGVGNLPPCFATKNWVTATINGIAATVTYAGWVADSVTGLYQINVTVPTKATTSSSAVSVPVVITANGISSQAGVTISIKD
jgi:uncharacterized protein (TIGR03437 family)